MTALELKGIYSSNFNSFGGKDCEKRLEDQTAGCKLLELTRISLNVFPECCLNYFVLKDRNVSLCVSIAFKCLISRIIK